MRKLLISVCSLSLITSLSFGQAVKPEITVKKIDVQLSQAPIYTVNSQKIPAGQPKRDSTKEWLVIHAELESEAEYVDDVQVKFYVVASYGAKGVSASPYDILESKVSVVGMRKNKGTGNKNIIPVFVDPNTVKKYGESALANFIPEVVVEVRAKGILQDLYVWKNVRKGVRFWEQEPTKPGVLLNLLQSPWWPAFADYYEQVKPVTPLSQ
jgi:hypothetical protein